MQARSLLGLAVGASELLRKGWKIGFRWAGYDLFWREMVDIQLENGFESSVI